MRIVIDTNVIVSGIFFGGTPRRIVKAVQNEEFELVTSLEFIYELNISINRSSPQANLGKMRAE